MPDDIEHLKKNKITPERIEAETGRLFLPTLREEPEVRDIVHSVESTPPGEPVDEQTLTERIVDVLKTVHDPEIPLNIYDLGLIYGFQIEDESKVQLQMTLTAPGCPVAGSLVKEVAEKVASVDGVSLANVQLVWDPPWTQDRMTDEAKLALGLL